jgi:hypothetical protein
MARFGNEIVLTDPKVHMIHRNGGRIWEIHWVVGIVNLSGRVIHSRLLNPENISSQMSLKCKPDLSLSLAEFGTTDHEPAKSLVWTLKY